MMDNRYTAEIARMDAYNADFLEDIQNQIRACTCHKLDYMDYLLVKGGNCYYGNDHRTVWDFWNSRKFTRLTNTLEELGYSVQLFSYDYMDSEGVFMRIWWGSRPVQRVGYRDGVQCCIPFWNFDLERIGRFVGHAACSWQHVHLENDEEEEERSDS